MRLLAPPPQFWTRWAAIAITLATSFSIATPAHAQTAAKRAQVGVLGVTPSIPATTDMFKQGLAQLGFTEGQQVDLVLKDADSDPARLPSVAADLVRTKPDVIFARGPTAVATAVRATRTIPIVAVDLESDPLALGYAKTLAGQAARSPGSFSISRR